MLITMHKAANSGHVWLISCVFLCLVRASTRARNANSSSGKPLTAEAINAAT